MANFIDEFSSAHPKNQQSGRWKRLNQLEPADPDYVAVEKQFHRGWKHSHKPKPRIKAVYKIISPDSLLTPYHQHRARVAAGLATRAPPSNPANEHLLFHGTNRICLLGEDRSRIQLCMIPECHLCCIIRYSFDIGKCGTKNKFRRFGTGIYTTAVSSKADDYSMNMHQKSAARVVLLNRVVVGKAHRRKYNAVNLTSAPSGFHSIIGEPGADLNYEETVVYTNDAIRPAFLIVYDETVEQSPPPPPPPKTKHKIHTVITTLFKTPVAS